MNILNFSWPKTLGVLLFVTSLPAAANSAPSLQLENNEPQATANLLVPENFSVPAHVELPNIQLQKVNPAYAEQDYKALMAARLQIRQALGTDWPADNLTLAENKASLLNDLSAFNQKTNFTYHLFAPESGRLIGCLYISQSGISQSHAAVYYWLVPDVDQSSMHLAIRTDIKKWIETRWPFKRVDYLFESTFA